MTIRFEAADAHWRVTPSPTFTPDQKDWLTRGGSLTAHLRALGAVVVRVTREAVAPGWRDEYDALQLAPRAPVWVREVVLSVDGVPFVAAHSITPVDASTGVWQAMRKLRTRPLAELLYSDSGVARSALVSRCVGARHPLHRLSAVEVEGGAPHVLLARRSVFERHGAPLMVTECMLPALWARLDDLREQARVREAPAALRARERERERGGRPLDHTASRAHAHTVARQGQGERTAPAPTSSSGDAAHDAGANLDGSTQPRRSR